MTEQMRQAMKERHTVRQFDGTPLTDAEKSILRSRVDELNKQYDLSIALIESEKSPLSFLGKTLMGGTGVYSYFVLAADDRDGVDEMLQCIQQVKENFNPKLTFRGCVITSFRGNEVNRQGLSYLDGFAKYKLMKAQIHWSAKVDESTFASLPIIEHSPRSWVCRDYKKLADEYLEAAGMKLSESDNMEGRA